MVTFRVEELVRTLSKDCYFSEAFRIGIRYTWKPLIWP